MARLRLLVVSTFVATLLTVPFSGPARAAHNCGLQDVSSEADTVCDNYHNPKPLLAYIICHFITRTC